MVALFMLPKSPVAIKVCVLKDVANDEENGISPPSAGAAGVGRAARTAPATAPLALYSIEYFSHHNDNCMQGQGRDTAWVAETESEAPVCL